MHTRSKDNTELRTRHRLSHVMHTGWKDKKVLRTTDVRAVLWDAVLVIRVALVWAGCTEAETKQDGVRCGMACSVVRGRAGEHQYEILDLSGTLCGLVARERILVIQVTRTASDAPCTRTTDHTRSHQVTPHVHRSTAQHRQNGTAHRRSAASASAKARTRQARAGGYRNHCSCTETNPA